MIFLYILEYTLIGFLYLRFIEWMVDDDETIRESKMSKTLTILFWPIPLISFVVGVINGLYKAITK